MEFVSVILFKVLDDLLGDFRMLVLGSIVFQKESSDFLKLGVAFLASIAKLNTILISEVIDLLASGTAVLAVSFLTGVSLGNGLGSQIEEDLLRD